MNRGPLRYRGSWRFALAPSRARSARLCLPSSTHGALLMKRCLPLLLLLPALIAATPPSPPPDLIVHNAKIVTLDDKSRIAQALAVRDGRILAVGDNAAILKLRGPATKTLDARGKTVLPGLYDSHVHP